MSKQVLVVDDSRTARVLCGAAVKQLRPDYALLEAGSGAEALKVVTETVPDYAIVDMNMPGMDGLELASQLRERLPTLPICLLTANVQSATRQRADDMRVFFFGKPVTGNAMREMLTRMEA